MGFAELLDRPNLSDQKRFEFSKLIMERSQDLLTVVNDILDISKLEAGHLSVVPICIDINELFHRLLLTFHAESFYLRNKNISIASHNQLPIKKSKVMADFIRLYQVLSNLLTNASKFTSTGAIEFGCKFQDQNVLLFWVKDSGIGIPANQLNAIFKPFRQATESIHQNYGGSGLGLAICKGLIELWGGQIWVESEVGIGSSFFFTLPYVPGANSETENFTLQPPSGKQLI
jgi:signal transduction histidine kinase